MKINKSDISKFAKRIRSCSWLNGVNHSIILTPCFDNNMLPTKVTISKAEFLKIKDSKDLMKLKAAEVILTA